MNIVFKNGQINPKYAQASQLIQACSENVREKQQALLEEYHLDQLKGYKIDFVKNTLTLNYKFADAAFNDYGSPEYRRMCDPLAKKEPYMSDYHPPNTNHSVVPDFALY